MGANGVVIDGFSVTAEGNNLFLSGVYMSGRDNAFLNAGNIQVSGTESTGGIDSWGLGGTGTISISEGSSIKVTTQGDFASGIAVFGTGDWVIDQSGLVDVHADGTLALGINAYRFSLLPSQHANLLISGDGDVKVTADEGAGGIILGVTAEEPTEPAFLPLQRLALDYGGSVTVTAEAEDSVAAGVVAYAQGNDNSVMLRGDVEVEAGALARGVKLSLRDDAEVDVSGSVAVDARSSGSRGYGVSVSLGHGGRERGWAMVAGEVTVTAGAEAVGVEMQVGSGNTVTVSNRVEVVARDDGSNATGVAITGLDGTVVNVVGGQAAQDGQSSLTVKGGSSAVAAQITVGGGSSVSVAGVIEAEARDEASIATGLQVTLGGRSTFELNGDLSVAAGSEGTGVKFTGSLTPDPEEPDLPGAMITLAGDIRVQATQATGLDLNDVTGSARIDNTATIHLAHGTAIDAAGSDADLTFVNRGAIFGDINLGSGAVNLELTENSRVDGDIDLGDTGAKRATLYAGTQLSGSLTSNGSSSSLALLAGEHGGTTRLKRIDFFHEAPGGRRPLDPGRRGLHRRSGYPGRSGSC